MTKESNDEEWSSESVHYWTVIRSDRNNIVKKGADQLASSPAMLSRSSTLVSSDGCMTSPPARLAQPWAAKLGNTRCKTFSNRAATRLVGLMILPNVPAGRCR